jgi:hypothetical protein
VALYLSRIFFLFFALRGILADVMDVLEDVIFLDV